MSEVGSEWDHQLNLNVFKYISAYQSEDTETSSGDRLML